LLTCSGFTTSELQALEALAPLFEAELKTLSEQPLHPILQKQQWEKPRPLHEAPFPLGNGRDGYWEASCSFCIQMNFRGKADARHALDNESCSLECLVAKFAAR